MADRYDVYGEMEHIKAAPSLEEAARELHAAWHPKEGYFVGETAEARRERGERQAKVRDEATYRMFLTVNAFVEGSL